MLLPGAAQDMHLGHDFVTALDFWLEVDDMATYFFAVMLAFGPCSTNGNGEVAIGGHKHSYVKFDGGYRTQYSVFRDSPWRAQERETQMNAQRMTSDDLRRNWQSVVGNVRTGGTVVVEEANQAVAVLIPIEYFMALQEQIEDLQDIRAAEAAIEEYRRDPSTAISWEEAKNILAGDGPADAK